MSQINKDLIKENLSLLSKFSGPVSNDLLKQLKKVTNMSKSIILLRNTGTTIYTMSDDLKVFFTYTRFSTSI